MPPCSAPPTGELFILRAVPIIIVTPILVLITGKVDPRVLLGLGLGFLLVAGASWLPAGVATADAGYWSFAPALIVKGVDRGAGAKRRQILLGLKK